jgi:hypothetical protein
MTIRNQNVNGLRLNNTLVGATADTAITTPSVDWSKINIELTLHQDGVEHRIYSGKLLPVLVAQSLLKTDYEMFQGISANHANIKTLVDASGVKEISINGGNFYFGDIINLRGGDKIDCVITMDADCYHATADADVSFLTVEVIEGVGKQSVIPQWRILPITDNDGNPKYNLGDNVTMIALVNADKTSVLSADTVVDRVSLTSDRLQFKKLYSDLVLERIPMYPSIAAANDRYQSFIVHTSDLGTPELDRVQLELDVDVTEVVASKNFIVWRTFTTNAEIARRYAERNFKHGQAAQIKFSAPATKSLAISSLNS